MIELKPEAETVVEINLNDIPLTFHSTYYTVVEKLKKWLGRFYQPNHEAIFKDLFLLFIIATKKFLDHRSTSHLFRLLLAIHFMQKKLQRSATFSPHLRHLEIKWIPAALSFPFSSKPVLGCLIGFNVMDRYELFDEENILLALQKHLPELRLVRESSYCHTSQYKNLKLFYLEIEKKDGAKFSLSERKLLTTNLEEKVRNSIQTLMPSIFMGHNEEETYKNILVLSQEIHSLSDLPQAYITLFQQNKNEIIFRVTLVNVTPFHSISLKERFFDCTFVSQRSMKVRHLDDHPIEAHVFCLHLPREASLLRSDGSLDFYIARQKIVSLLHNAIGEFRDYNGGIIIKQQELLQLFKESFPDIARQDPELMESFFYALTPLEQQVLLNHNTLVKLFNYYLENRKLKLKQGSPYSLNIYRDGQEIFIIVCGDNPSLAETIAAVIQEQSFKTQDIAYNIIETSEGVFCSTVLLTASSRNQEPFIEALQQSLHDWHQLAKDRQILKIGMEYTLGTLDPRIAESSTSEIIKLLFEGLTRFNQKGVVENAIAESVSISSQSKVYTFKLRHCFWNDGTPVTAYDFEYAWKKILSPDFKTLFAYMFDPIKNAKEAKAGKVPLKQVGIHVIDERTLKVELERPTPYFLQLTANPLYSPVHHVVDQQHPEWPYQCDKNYPCNGPFQLKVNQPDQGFHLVKNPYYWNANEIVLDQITLTSMNSIQAYQAFQKKEIDWLGNPFGAWHDFYRPREEDRLVSSPNQWMVWMVLNTESPWFKHHKFRKAFSYAIDRSKIATGAFLALNPAFSPIFSQGRNGKSLFPEYNPEKARQFFNEALKETGLSINDLPPLTLEFYEKGIREYISVALKEQFSDCFNIECELRPIRWNKYFPQLASGQFNMGIIHWFSWVNDPVDVLNVFRTANNGVNFSRWEDLRFQKCVELSEQEVNPFIRSSHLYQAEEIISEEIPVIPLFYQSLQALVAPDLQINDKSNSSYMDLARSFFRKKE